MTRIVTPADIENMTGDQFAAYEAELRADQHFSHARGLVARLRPTPGPGRRPEEVERAVERRREREAAAAAEKARQREQAAQERADRKLAYDRLVQFRRQLSERQGQANFALEQAISAFDIDAAEAAGVRVEALRRVADRLSSAEKRIAVGNLGRGGPIPGAEIV